MESRSVSVVLNEMSLNCYFFSPDEIEFDIDPNEVNSIEDYQEIEKFMKEVSKTLDKQVTLAYETSPEFPLVKIDYNRGIDKVLTKQEVKKYLGNPS